MTITSSERKIKRNSGTNDIGHKAFMVLGVVILLLTVSMVALAGKTYAVASNGFVLGEMVPYEKSYRSNLVNEHKYIGLPDKTEKIWVTIALKWRNEPELRENLRSINDPHSGMYRHFYTWEEFRDIYAPPSRIYNALVEWIKAQGLHIQSTSAMRNSVIICDTIGAIEKAFNTKFELFKGDGVHYNKIYYANTKPIELPQNIIPYLYGVNGLNNATRYHQMFYTSSTYKDNLAAALDGVDIYRRYLTGADFQKLYHVFELYNNSATAQASTTHIFATGIRVATVLWEGADSSGNQYAPFDPNVVKYYYYKVTPTWIQNALTAEVGYNVSQVGWYGTTGTVAPGSNTDGGVSAENELDLEMVGTLAPGVEAYCVYGPGNSNGGPSETDFPDPEYNYILNTLAKQTDRVLVGISNSWGTYGDGTLDGSSEPDIQALNALGVTVFASSGDDAATKPSIPANVATDTYGVVAVGGTTPIPDGTDHNGLDDISLMAYNINFWNKPNTNPRLDEVVWYDTTGTTSNGNYWGTQCGVSTSYSEPQFQLDTIGDQGGRVIADISAVANRTLVYLSTGYGTSNWYLIAGTSVASPVMAGIFGEMAAYVGREYGYGGNNIRGFGWIDPTLYYLGYDYYNNSLYSTSPPFWDVTRVWPSGYPAPPSNGYDMPTGWGVPDAWNLVHDIGFRITTLQGERIVNVGKSTWYNLKVWYPYGWNTTVGHFKVYGLPAGTFTSFNVSYVNARGWLNNTTAVSNLNLTIITTSITPAGTYTIYVVGYTVNKTLTTEHWGNLTYNLSLTLIVNQPVPEFSTALPSVIIGLFAVLIVVVVRRKDF